MLRIESSAAGTSNRSRMATRWEAPCWERHRQVPSLELLGGPSEGHYERSISSVKLLTSRLARRVEQWGWRLLRLSGAVEGVLPTNGGGPQDLTARELAAGCGLRFDLGDEIGDELSPFLFRKMLPTGERRESQGLGGLSDKGIFVDEPWKPA
jgi:hypothetical protein